MKNIKSMWLWLVLLVVTSVSFGSSISNYVIVETYFGNNSLSVLPFLNFVCWLISITGLSREIAKL